MNIIYLISEQPNWRDIQKWISGQLGLGWMTYSFVLMFSFIALQTELTLYAQESTVPKTPQLQPPEASTAEALNMPVTLKDKDGNLVDVPRLEYEKFEQFLRSQLDRKMQPSASFTLDHIHLEGRVEGDYAQVEITLKAHVSGDLDRSISLPISLSNLIIEKVTFDGPFQSSVRPLEKSSSAIDQTPTSGFDVPASTIEGLKELAVAPDASDATAKLLVWTIAPSNTVKQSENESAETSDANSAVAKLTPVSLRLQGYLKINNDGQKRSINFDLPLAIQNQKIFLPRTAREMTWSGDANLKFSELEANDYVVVESSGMSQSSELSWNEISNDEEINATEVQSSTRLEFNSDGTPWTAITRLQLKSTTATSARDFVLTLPANAQWIPPTDINTRGGWTLTRLPVAEVNSAGSESAETASRVAEIRIGAAETTRLRLRVSADELARSNNPVEIRWKWLPDTKKVEDFNLEMLSIENIDRHEGTIELIMPAQTELIWRASMTSSLLKRVIEATVPERLNYTFKFSRTPLELQCSIIGAVDRLQYKPEFIAQLKEQSIELTALLTFAVDPTKMVGLEIHTNDWTVDKVLWNQTKQPIDFLKESEDVIRFDPASLYRRSDTLNGTESPNGRTIKLVLLKPLDTVPTDVVANFSLPTIAWLNDQGQSIKEIGTGWLTIFSPQWRIERASIATESMIPANTSSEAVIAFGKETAQTTFQSYLFGSDKSIPSWRAKIVKKPSLATQRVNSKILIDDKKLSIWQSRRISQNNCEDLACELMLPDLLANALANTSNIVGQIPNAILTMNGALVACQIVTTNDQQSANDQQPVSATRRSRDVPEGWSVVALKLGEIPPEFNLELNATVPFPGLQTNSVESKAFSELSELEIPFLKLNSSENLLTLENSVELTTATSLLVTVVDDGKVKCIYPGKTLALNALNNPSNFLKAKVERVETVAAGSVQINQIWLQTALNGSERRDRCVIDLSTAEKQIELELFDIDLNNLTSVLVDGQRVEPQRIERTSSLIVPFPDDEQIAARIELQQPNPDPFDSPSPAGASKQIDVNQSTEEIAPRRRTVELWLWSTASQQMIRKIDENLPLIKDAKEPSPKLWQIILPEHDHLWTTSSPLLPQFQWAWNGVTLQRKSVLQQADLERITHASTQPTFGPETNRYLLATFGTNLSKTSRATADYVYTVPRYVLFAPTSLFCLALTTMLLYFPMLRSVWFFAVLAACGALIATLSTDLALLLLQVAFASLIFVVVVLLVRWILDLRMYQRTVFVNRTRTSQSAVRITESIQFEIDSHADSNTAGFANLDHNSQPKINVATTHSIEASRHRIPIAASTVDVSTSSSEPIE